MPPSVAILPRSIPTQLALAAVGMLAFAVYARSWKDFSHLAYDIPASFAVFALSLAHGLVAGSDRALVVIGVVFLVLIILELVGVTNVFTGFGAK